MVFGCDGDVQRIAYVGRQCGHCGVLAQPMQLLLLVRLESPDAGRRSRGEDPPSRPRGCRARRRRRRSRRRGHESSESFPPEAPGPGYHRVVVSGFGSGRRAPGFRAHTAIAEPLPTPALPRSSAPPPLGIEALDLRASTPDDSRTLPCRPRNVERGRCIPTMRNRGWLSASQSPGKPVPRTWPTPLAVIGDAGGTAGDAIRCRSIRAR